MAPLANKLRRQSAKPAPEDGEMTDRIWVDLNSRNEDGYVPASRRRLGGVPAAGSIVDTIDDRPPVAPCCPAGT
jgi:hypothetical protein